MDEKGLVAVDMVAKLANMTARRYRQLAKDDIVPEPKNGKVPFIKSIQDLFAYKDKLISGSGNLSLTDERTRLTALQADKVNFQLEVLRKEYLKTEDVIHKWEQIISVCKSRLMSIGAKLAPYSILCKTATEAKELYDRELFDACNELRNIKASEFDNGRCFDADVDSTAKVKSKRMGRKTRVSKP